MAEFGTFYSTLAHGPRCPAWSNVLIHKFSHPKWALGTTHVACACHVLRRVAQDPIDERGLRARRCAAILCRALQGSLASASTVRWTASYHRRFLKSRWPLWRRRGRHPTSRRVADGIHPPRFSAMGSACDPPLKFRALHASDRGRPNANRTMSPPRPVHEHRAQAAARLAYVDNASSL